MEENKDLTQEDLRQINNKLVEITLSTNKMMEEREKIYKRVNEIKSILDK